jgi:L-ribulose-5-phosphate 3-epimerase
MPQAKGTTMTTESSTRRAFISASAAAGLSLAAVGRGAAAPFKTTLSKALILKDIDAETMLQYKTAGFDGVECGAWDVSPAEAEKARAIADKAGMRIHSVLRGWVNFNDAAKVEDDVASLEVALKAARGYGADAILMVPCRFNVKGVAAPQPWEFDIDFDEKTGHVTRVAKGDNAQYQQYIDAQNLATDMSRAALKRLIPAAEKAKVVIAVENVWNGLWVKPDLAANFVRSFDSPWIQYYFDVGNHVKYAPPEEWIRALGKLIVKVHIKDFKLDDNGQGGKFVDIRDGSVDWPSVRAELDKIGYNGWMTIEGSGKLSVEERSKRLDLIVAGK